MTRAQVPIPGFEVTSFGAIGARRVVFVLRTGAMASLDPDPAVTHRRRVRVVALGLDPVLTEDPGVFGGQTPAETAADALLDVIEREAEGEPAGLVAVGDTGVLGLLVAGRGHAIDRLAFIAVERPPMRLDAEDISEIARGVAAKALILNGPGQAADARWLHEALPASRIEMVPVSAIADADGRLGLADVWGRVLSHCAPGTGGAA